MPDRPPHPGEVLARLMVQRGIVPDDLIAAGLPARWVSDLLRRIEEIPLRLGRDRLVLLAAATRTPESAWEQVQVRWHRYRIHQHAESVIRRRGMRS